MRHADQLTFREPLSGDISRVASNMRAWDVRECKASGLTPRAALRLGVLGSSLCYTACVEGRAEAMFGVTGVSTLDRTGSPWLLATERAYDYPRAWLEVAPRFLALFRHRYPGGLENYVHRDNVRAVRLLRRLGFDIAPEAVHIGGEPMLKFARG